MEKKQKQRKYEVSHICAAVVAVVAIVVVAAIALDGLVSFEASKMTDWISVLISGGALVVSVLALIYLKGTFEATRAQADAAKATNELAVRNHKLSQRPFLEVDGAPEFYLGGAGRERDFWVNVTMKNTGQSIAGGVSVKAKYFGKQYCVSDVGAGVRCFASNDKEGASYNHNPRVISADRVKVLSAAGGAGSERFDFEYVFVSVRYGFIERDEFYQAFKTAFAFKIVDGRGEYIEDSTIAI